MCSNLCGRMGELVANCEAVKVLVFSVPVLLAVIPLRPGCCNRGYQIFYHSLFESTSFDFCLIQNNDFKHCAKKIKMDSQLQESLFSYRVPSYQHQFVKTRFRRVWSKMSSGYFRNPWDLPHLVHRPLWP